MSPEGYNNYGIYKYQINGFKETVLVVIGSTYLLLKPRINKRMVRH